MAGDDLDSELSTMLRQSAEDFVGAQHEAAGHRGIRNLPRNIDRAVWHAMAGLGWLGLGVPESLGGSEMGLEGAAELALVFGRTVFQEPYIAACVMPTAIITAGGEKAAARELASAMIDGSRVLTLAWQEHAGQLAPTAPVARLRDGAVSGRKLFVPAVEREGVLLVHVDTLDGEAVVAVSSEDARVRCERHPSGMGPLATVHLDAAPTLHERPLLVGDDAGRGVRNALDCARIALAAQLTGVAKGVLECTLQHVADRVQFGRQVGSFQVIQHRCVNLYLGIQLADASWRHALRTWQESQDSPAAAAAISAAKARSSDVALEVSRAALQMHGAMGFTDEAQPGLYLRAAMHGAAWLGTANLHRRNFQAMRCRDTPHA